MQLKKIAIGLSVVTLTGCVSTNQTQLAPGSESLNEILSQYDSNRYVIVSDPHALSAAERSKLESEGYKLLKTDKIDESAYMIAPVADTDFSTSTLKQYMTKDGVSYRFLNSVPAEDALLETAVVVEEVDEIDPLEDDLFLLASNEDDVDQELIEANLQELEEADHRAHDAEQKLAEALSLSEEKSEELEELRRQAAEAAVEVETLKEALKALEDPEPTFEWFAGETLQQALRRWVEDAGYNSLVWYVYDQEGDVIEIPIASDHAFTSDLPGVLSKVKRAYATAPRNPINLDFTIKRGNKAVIVTNPGAAR